MDAVLPGKHRSGNTLGAPKDCKSAPRLAGGVAAEVARVQRRQVAGRQRHRAALGAAGRIRDRRLSTAQTEGLDAWCFRGQTGCIAVVHCNVGCGMAKA
jgi:hypothetical protein